MLLKSSTPRRYPAIEENTTLIAKPAFVICLKSEVIFFIETFSVGVFKFSDYLNGAKVMVRKRFDKKINIISAIAKICNIHLIMLKTHHY